MSSTLKSNRRKSKKFNIIPKAKRQRQVEQPSTNWLELPSDIMANILHRVGVYGILVNAQKVCTAWRKICKDPVMWRVIYLDARRIYLHVDKLRAMCKHAVDRSQGQLIDITMVEFCDDELLLYVADRASQLRRLEIALSYGDLYRSWTKALTKYRASKDLSGFDMYVSWTYALKKFPLLEELNFYRTEISTEAIEIVGRYCPMLKALKVNTEAWEAFPDELYLHDRNKIAIAIGENLHKLEHLEIVGNIMSNIGLQTVLDGCRHLKSLDLRRCLAIDLKGDLGERCSEHIKCLKLPNDSIEGFPYIYQRGPCLYGFRHFDSLQT